MAEKVVTEAATEFSLRCSICLETYKEPKVLPCCHTFCKGCLAKLPVMRKAGPAVPVEAGRSEDEPARPQPLAAEEMRGDDDELGAQIETLLNEGLSDVELEGRIEALLMEEGVLNGDDSLSSEGSGSDDTWEPPSESSSSSSVDSGSTTRESLEEEVKELRDEGISTTWLADYSQTSE